MILFLIVILAVASSEACEQSITSVSGSEAPGGQICRGQMLLDENFNDFNSRLWKHEKTLSGGGHWEFQWYSDDWENAFVEDGKLYMKPTLTSDKIGEHNLYNGHVDVDGCTDSRWYGCHREGHDPNIINPIRSAKLKTRDTFAFKYGRVEIWAKMPVGDWLWPALWLLPQSYTYGDWPRSGEITLVESRGNTELSDWTGQIGTQRVTSTLHWGPAWNQNAYAGTQYKRDRNEGYNDGFHKFEMEWTDNHITFKVDDQETGTVWGNNGFWSRGGFQGSNIWERGNNMAPFDQEFHFVLNLAVGGTNHYFPDTGDNRRGKKPWQNSSPHAAKDFWSGRDQWLHTWQLNHNNGKDASLIVDSIKVWAI